MDHCRRTLLRCAVLPLLGAGLAGCRADPLRIRLALSVWPGYLFIAHALRVNAELAHLIQPVFLGGPTLIIRALQAGVVDAACLTLDDALTAAAGDVPLSVVALLDESAGADQIVARAPINSMLGLKHQRIGLEDGSLGALVLAAALARNGMSPADVLRIRVPFEQQQAAFGSGQIDAVVTFEPVASALRQQGAVMVYSTQESPGLITDVLAVRSDRFAAARSPLAALLAEHFRLLEAFRKNRQMLIGQGLGRELAARGQPASSMLTGVRMLDQASNQALFARRDELLLRSRNLLQLLQSMQLLSAAARPNLQFDGSCLPVGGA